MTITNGYCTVNELKGRLINGNPTEAAATGDNAAYENIIEAVSRAIDRLKNRQFFATSATRYFTANASTRCKIDDLLSLTSLKTDDDSDGVYETTWTTSDYRLFPFNSAPYMEILTRPATSYYFPLDEGSVQIVGSFGYSNATPKVISEACLLGSMRLWGRKDLLYGIAGSAELGTMQVIASLKKDGEFMTLLDAIPTRRV